MTAFLLDVTRWQAGIDLARARAEGFTLVNVQLTGRDGYVFPDAGRYVAQARALGMGVCVYHWLDGSQLGAVQAGQTWQRIGDLGGPEGLAHQVDCEDSANPATWPIWRDYVNAIQDRLGRHVAAYTGDWWWTPRGWSGGALTPYLWAAPNAGYPGSYPGDISSQWKAGWGGWSELAVMQYAVADVDGVRCSLSAVRDPNVWAALTGGDHMPAPYLNPALTTMRAEVNDRFPRRDKESDGWIGDPAHQARTSDHNPDADGSVDAWDMDVNLRGPGLASGADVEFVKRRFEAHEAAKYWIHNDQICFRSEGWKPRSYAYAGPNRNRHEHHVHFNSLQEHENSTRPWGIKEDDMADLTPENLTQIADAVWAKLYKDRNLPPNPDGSPQTRTTGALLMDARSDARGAAVDAAKDEARDAAVMALVQKLVDLVNTGTGGGEPITTAVLLAEIRSQGAAAAAQVEQLLALIDELQADNDALRAQIDAVPDAVVAEIAS